MRIEGLVEESAVQIALLGGFTLLAGKTRLIEKFQGTNALGILYPLPFDVLAVIGASIIHEERELKPQNAILLKSAFIVSVSVMTATQAHFMGETIQLPFSSSLRLGLIKSIIVSYSAIPFLFKRLASRSYQESNQHWNENNFDHEPEYDPYFHEPRIPVPRIPQQQYARFSGNTITVTVDRADLTDNPKPYIRNFSNLLASNWNSNTIPDLRAGFHNERGIDAGGLRRDYCDSLFNALSNDLSLFQGSLPSVANKDDIQTFKDMGTAFMYFYQVTTNMAQSSHIHTGNHYHDNLFKAALALTAIEIDTPFHSLSTDAKLRISHILAEESYEFFKDNPDAEVTVDFFNETVAPIHALAQGMKSKCHLLAHGAIPNTHWDNVTRHINHQTMSIRIQGALDRSTIANAFTTTFARNHHVGIKVTWLQEWIRNEATELEIKQLLKFATGSSSLAEGRQIRVFSEQVWNEIHLVNENTPFPIAHTCGPSIGLSPEPCELNGFHNRTKEGFIRCMKLTIVGDSAFTQG